MSAPRTVTDLSAQTKRCSRCREVKALDEFRRIKSKTSQWAAQCRSCERLSLRESRSRNPDRTRAWSRAWRAKNRDRILAHDSERWLRTACERNGISVEDYNDALSRQGGLCAICRQPQRHATMRRLVIDHDHFTGAFRGLLCSNCNQALGLMGDDPDLLRQAAAYLAAPDVQQGRLRVVE